MTDRVRRWLNPRQQKLDPGARLELVIKKADEMVQRYQAQIAGQVASITRLLEGDRSYDQEMANLHDQLARRTVERDTLALEVQRLKGER